MSNVTVCSYDSADGSSDAKRRKVKKSLIPFMDNCSVIEGTEEVVDESRLDEDGFLMPAK
jgi:hypothetical protein